ncbi:MAG: hypothetical protein R2863_05175 [Candidatus Kapaibacterium sp.]|nr:hypothetical protein [Ignavibacteriota bacterium]MCB9221267.1 hypothetical protein [Ignavibacteria bacterium]
MKKIILIMTIIIISPILSYSGYPESVMFLGDCNSSNPELDYLKFEFLNTDTNQAIYKSVLYVDCSVSPNFYYLEKKASELKDTDTTYSFDDVNIKLIRSSLDTSTSHFEVVGELYYNLDSDSKGLLFLDSRLASSDTVNIVDPNNPMSIFEYNVKTSKYNGYILSWTGETDYFNEYTILEIQEVLVFNDGDNYLYRLEDTDRGNKLVGLKYYSNNNSTLYTRYFEPNN